MLCNLSRCTFLLALSGMSFGATSLVTNGGFESGNVGFTSNLTLSSDLYNEATYYIDANPGAYHPLWANFGGHPGNAGNMMIVNAATTADQMVWGQSGITVLANTNYIFSVWVASLYAANPAQFKFNINGAQVGSTYTMPATVGEWTQSVIVWNSGSSTTASLAIFDQTLTANGNDFAIDDIFFGQSPAPLAAGSPEPASFLLVGGALCGLLIRRK